jgi:hypothetical protein
LPGGLLTDLYELNMAASYLRRHMTGQATFSLFSHSLAVWPEGVLDPAPGWAPSTRLAPVLAICDQARAASLALSASLARWAERAWSQVQVGFLVGRVLQLSGGTAQQQVGDVGQGAGDRDPFADFQDVRVAGVAARGAVAQQVSVIA